MWISQLKTGQMRSGKKSHDRYSEDFKWKVVQEVISGKLNKEEARRAYGIRSNCAILYWMRKFSGNDDYRRMHSFSTDLLQMSESKAEKALEDRIKQLEADLRRAELRADLWQKMVEVAEDKLQIDIKKKYGAQPSKLSDKEHITRP